KVFIRNPACRVRLQFHPKLAPSDRKIGMVVRGLTEVTDGVRQHECRRPAVRGVFASNPAFFEIPVGQSRLLQFGRNFGVAVGFFLLLSHGSSPRIEGKLVPPRVALGKRWRMVYTLLF